MARRRDPADRTTGEVALDLGVTPEYLPDLARKARVLDNGTYKAGRRRYYTPAAVAIMRAWRAAHGVDRPREVDVDTAMLQRWYLERRYSAETISRWLGIGQNALDKLLTQRGIRGRPAGPLRCECGMLFDEHERCARCGLVLCAAFPEHGPGPVCNACRREFVAGLRELLATRVPVEPERESRTVGPSPGGVEVRYVRRST